MLPLWYFDILIITVCEYSDKKYASGDSFPANDSPCNKW